MSTNAKASVNGELALRDRVEAQGSELVRVLERVSGSLPFRPTGPQVVAKQLGLALTTSSRLLKGLAQADAVAALHELPGPKPLTQFVESAGSLGVSDEIVKEAKGAIAELDDMILQVAGSRGAFKALLATWLPELTAEFDADRRQAIYKAMSEYRGVSAELDVSSTLIFPGAKPDKLSAAITNCSVGIDRIRPDAVVRTGTMHYEMPKEGTNGRKGTPRVPTSLDGADALNGMDDIRLDQFCNAPPARLVSEHHDGEMQYTLALSDTVGPASRVDLVTCEVNRDELPHRKSNLERPPSIFTVVRLPTKRLLFDVVLHKDVFPGETPRILIYDTVVLGTTFALNPARTADLRRNPPSVELLEPGLSGMRTSGFPRYYELQEHIFSKLELDPADFRTFRVSVRYPIVGDQVTMAFVGDKDAG